MIQLDLFEEDIRNEPPAPGFYQARCIDPIGPFVKGVVYWVRNCRTGDAFCQAVILNKEGEWRGAESSSFGESLATLNRSLNSNLDGWFKRRFERVDDYETT